MKPYSQFIVDLAARESKGSGDYLAKNKYGFLGRYQFGLGRLCDFGLCARKPGTKDLRNESFTWVPPYSESLFLGTPALQDKCFDVHVGQLRRMVVAEFSPALGKTFCGVELTLSGAVACCHLLGRGGLVNFVRGQDLADALGTRASEYVRLFSGYEIPEGLPTAVPLVLPTPAPG